MATIEINDLLDSRELDRRAMAALLGGCGGFSSYNWIQPYFETPSARSPSPASSGSALGGTAGSVFPASPGLEGASAVLRRAVSLEQELSITLSFRQRISTFEELALFNS